MNSKFEANKKELDFYQRKCSDYEKQISEYRERENMLNLKYGVLINQNEEMAERIKYKDEMISLLKSIIQRNDKQKDIELLSLRQQLSKTASKAGSIDRTSLPP